MQLFLDPISTPSADIPAFAAFAASSGAGGSASERRGKKKSESCRQELCVILAGASRLRKAMLCLRSLLWASF